MSDLVAIAYDNVETAQQVAANATEAQKSHIIELEDMVHCGLTPAEAHVAATRTAAEVIKSDQLGTVAPGKSAAFVVLDANPLDAITNTRQINKVYLRGQEVDRAALRKTLTQ